jgi:2-dehydropantoate 2-reductase
MKILVYGAGAVGGYLGAKLALSGHDVTLVTRPVMAEAINTSGLSIAEAGQAILSRPTAVTTIAQAFMPEGIQYDLILMTMKSYDLVPALDPLVAFCPDPPTIITVQNGIDVEQPLINQFGAPRVIAGSLTTPISKDTTNNFIVEREDRGLALAPTQPRQNIKQWVNLFQKAGVTTMNAPDYKSMKWSKALLNIVGNATSAILNRPPGLVYKSPSMFDLEVRMLREAVAVMDKLKLKVVDLPGSPTGRLLFGLQRLPKSVLQPILARIVASGRGDKMPSFHVDLMAGKGKSEVIFHNGAIAKAGQEQNVPTPVNTALTDVLWRLTREEVDWRDFDGKPKRLLAEVQKYEQRGK